MPGVGAEDAWYETALRTEHCKVKGITTTGGAVDISKCLDQIQRVILFWFMLMSGMPAKVVMAYFRLHDHVKEYNSLAGGLGKPYYKFAAFLKDALLV